MRDIQVRPPAVAGMFYSSEPAKLRQEIASCFEAANRLTAAANECPDSFQYQAFICPHAGFIYSGGVAATAYRYLSALAPKKVAVLGPSHRVYLRGVAAPSDDYFRTPLGDVAIEKSMIEVLLSKALVKVDDQPHALEHSLEVQLPFLQSCLDQFELLPLVVGDESSDVVSQIIAALRKQGFFIIASSDLSHFLTYAEAVEKDAHTAEKILRKEAVLDGEEACGCRVLNGLLAYAKQNDWHIEQFSQINSGDTAGDKSRVVGYGAFGLGV